MASFNRVVLMGNLTRNPELKYLPNGTALAEFGLAVNEKRKDKESTLFVDCTAFQRTAEIVNQYCQKGKPVLIEGRLKLDQWEDKTSGQKRSKHSIVVDGLQLLGSRDEQPSAPREQQAGQEWPAKESWPAAESDIPF